MIDSGPEEATEATQRIMRLEEEFVGGKKEKGS